MRLLRGLLVAVALLLLVAGGIAGWLLVEYRRFTADAVGGPEERDLEVAAGATLSEVAAALEAAGVVSDGTRFFIFARLQGAERKLKKGEYVFVGPQTPAQVLEALVAGRVKTYRVTVPEGLRLEEVAPLFAAVGDPPKFAAAARDPALLRRLGIDGDSAEGYLFPDTYLEPRGRAEAALVEEMVAHFRKAFAEAQLGKTAGLSLSDRQAVTLASIVEKETGAPEERPRIACVFYNRLKLGMKLQTDPTVIYAQLLSTGRFDGNLTKAMLLTPHPYNTYTTPGLPPGPIANPGAAALQAVFHPSSCKDLYFVAKGGGRHAFCPDLVCHNANVVRYQLGGR